MEIIKTRAGNFICEFDDFYLSYNDMAIANSYFDKEEEKIQPETAIVDKSSGSNVFYILYGQHFDNLVKLAKQENGLKKCLEYFEQHKSERAFFSDK